MRLSVLSGCPQCRFDCNSLAGQPKNKHGVNFMGIGCPTEYFVKEYSLHTACSAA